MLCKNLSFPGLLRASGLQQARGEVLREGHHAARVTENDIARFHDQPPMFTRTLISPGPFL
jgi:hypothetical protein